MRSCSVFGLNPGCIVGRILSRGPMIGPNLIKERSCLEELIYIFVILYRSRGLNLGATPGRARPLGEGVGPIPVRGNMIGVFLISGRVVIMRRRVYIHLYFHSSGVSQSYSWGRSERRSFAWNKCFKDSVSWSFGWSWSNYWADFLA